MLYWISHINAYENMWIKVQFKFILTLTSRKIYKITFKYFNNINLICKKALFYLDNGVQICYRQSHLLESVSENA